MAWNGLAGGLAWSSCDAGDYVDWSVHTNWLHVVMITTFDLFLIQLVHVHWTSVAFA